MSGILCWLECAAAIFTLVSLVTYFVPYLIQAFLLSEQDLKKKYNAEWAVVTGASSGIGRAITEKLAMQGINVVMVALDNNDFKSSFPEVSAKYPTLQFRKVPVNLGESDPESYMVPIRAATKDILPTLIFNNAGYMATALFADAQLKDLVMNYNCNATSMIHITHLFLNRILDAKRKGAVFFTSSPAGLNASPTVCMYGSTKAWMTSFASSLASEVRSQGVDVLVVHPSPVDTAFYRGNTAGLSAPAAFQKTAGSPVNVASCYFRSIGRFVNHDQGYYPIVFRTLLKFLDPPFFNQIIAWTGHTTGDYKKILKPRPLDTAPIAYPSTGSSGDKKRK